MEYSRKSGLHPHKGCWIAIEKGPPPQKRVAEVRTYEQLRELVKGKDHYMLIKDCTDHYDLRDWFLQTRFSWKDISIAALVISVCTWLFVSVSL